MEEELNLTQLANSVTLRLSGRKVMIRVFLGGASSIHSTCLPAVIKQLLWNRNLYTVGKENWSEVSLVNWLLDADIYLICCHPHQGTSGFGWDVTTLYQNLDRLCGHMGFPLESQLLCPIFPQDKYNYIDALGSRANPTLRLR